MSAAGRPAAGTPAAAASLPGIELLRFVCAFAVLMWHYQHFSYVANQAHQFDPVQQPFYPLLSFFYRYGLYGVQVFWCISGFIFFWKYGAVLARRELGAGRFFVLRFSRLYPLHLATLLLVALLQALYAGGHGHYFVYRDNSVGSFLLQLPLASHWLYPLTGFSFNGPIWSVSLEVLAYAAFFLWSRHAGVGAPATLAAALAAGLAWRYADWPLLECLLYFYLGALVALAYALVAGWSAPRRAAAVLAAAALLVLVLAAPWRYPIAPGSTLLLATPLAIGVALALRPRGPAGRALASLGNLTYSSYLLHFPLQLGIALGCGAAGVAVPWRSPWLWLFFIGATFALAHLCYRTVEMPLQRRLRR
ncbi:acyltransferase [Oxalobacteraceae bacterium OTU3CINTB1]|nr:acyltransferase [Oxalobacteraceae bacterium OTU3CINTB1]